MALLLLLASACDTSTSEATADCVLPAPTLDPARAAPGEVVRASLERSTDDWDTVVMVGATRAEVLSLSVEGCEACSTCRDEQECESCGGCDACSADCVGCLESARFRVPELADGSWAVTVTNRYGATRAAELTIERSGDTAQP